MHKPENEKPPKGESVSDHSRRIFLWPIEERLEKKHGRLCYGKSLQGRHGLEDPPEYVATSFEDFFSATEKKHLANLEKIEKDPGVRDRLSFPWSGVALLEHEQMREEELRQNTFKVRGLLPQQPSTYGIHWPVFLSLYNQLLEIGYKDSEKRERICDPILHYIVWLAGLFYAIHSPRGSCADGFDEAVPLHSEKDGLEEHCNAGAKKFIALAKSEARDVAKVIGERSSLFGAARIVFGDLAERGSDPFSANVSAFLQSEPLKENRLRFFFGIGVETLYAADPKLIRSIKGDRAIIPAPDGDYCTDHQDQVSAIFRQAFGCTEDTRLIFH